MSAPPEPKINSTRGWNQLQHTMGKKMPQRLHAAGRARQGLMQLTRGKGRG